MGDSETSALIEIGAIPAADREGAAELIIEALPGFYGQAQLRPAMISAVGSTLGQVGTDTAAGFAAGSGQGVRGVLTYARADKLDLARLGGVQQLLRALDPASRRLFREHLREYDADFAAAPSGTCYLSRLAVRTEARGSGLAERMMRHWIQQVDLDYEDGFSLHVDRSNFRAIRFYERLGFEDNLKEGKFLLLTRAGGDSR
ncbi:GNAT family N-acetyltransferase [Planctomycetota bacterium]|nr:GNAT family N-acetyltransferase [Planctomycetota bacterium]